MKLLLPSAIALMLIVLLMESCKKEEDAPVSNEFVASNSTFKDFRTWTQVATVLGADPKVGTAHGGIDPDMERYIYQKKDQDTLKGKVFAKGTVFVKESFNTSKSTHEIVAMVKRGGSFNLSLNNWEWFVLNTDGTIKKDSTGASMRGANLLGGACGGCHYNAGSSPGGVDFVFTKYQ